MITNMNMLIVNNSFYFLLDRYCNTVGGIVMHMEETHVIRSSEKRKPAVRKPI